MGTARVLATAALEAGQGVAEEAQHRIRLKLKSAIGCCSYHVRELSMKIEVEL